MRVGFTGSRGDNNAGMTPAQAAAVAATLRRLIDGQPVRFALDYFRFGACRGADAQAARLAKAAGYWVVAHPGRVARDAPGGPRPDRDEESVRLSDEVVAEDTHFARNRAIVDACDVLIAAPAYPGPITKATKGGTAMTVNYARKVGRTLIIMWPDGSTTEERRGLARTVNPDGACTETWETT